MTPFATFFVSGVADEVLAFESVGHSYVDTIKCYFPDILLLNDDGKYFNNALELLFLCNERIEALELNRSKGKIKHVDCSNIITWHYETKITTTTNIKWYMVDQNIRVLNSMTYETSMPK